MGGLVEEFRTSQCGAGLRAVRDVVRGSVLLDERAEVADSPSALVDVVEARLDEWRLSPGPHDAPAAARPRREWAQLAFENNAFLTGPPPSAGAPPPQYALLPRAAKLNHSCFPNAALRRYGGGADGPLGARVVAVRDIAAGDEVTISYRGADLLLLPRPRRVQILQLQMNFACACARCAVADDPREAPLSAANHIAKDRAEFLVAEYDRVLELDGAVDDAEFFGQLAALYGVLRRELNPHHWRTRRLRAELIRFHVADFHMLRDSKEPAKLSKQERASVDTLADLLVEQMVAEKRLLPPYHNARLANYATYADLAAYLGHADPSRLRAASPEFWDELDWAELREMQAMFL